MNNEIKIEDKCIEIIHKVLTDFNKVNKIEYILNLGCRDGKESIEFSKIFPNAQIISVEANPEQIPIIEKNIKDYPNIKVYNFGASDKEEELDFYISSTINRGNSSFLEINHNYDHLEKMEFKKSIKVKTKRLDHFLKNINIPKIDLLWMDIQGFEKKALDGLSEYIQNIIIMYCEVTYKEMYKNQVLFDKIDFMLMQNKLTCLFRDYKHDDFWGDAIYGNFFNLNK
jgi:FkbM family methyltransferase